MLMTRTTQRGIDPAASATPLPRVDPTLQLSTQTVAWLADRPHTRRLVRSVWNKLTELERTGHDPDAVATLRFLLSDHQPPTRTGRCRTCRRHTWRCLWRRRRFPCGVWFTIDLGLQGLFTGTGRHRKLGTTPQPRTVAGPPESVPQAHPNHPTASASVGEHPPSCGDGKGHADNEAPRARAVA